jgi:peptide/nickel transport system substrate-binding protein
MRRRDLITAGITAAAAVVMPRLARAERSNKLVFAPTNDLTTLDPVVTFARPTRNHGYLVFDTLYGIDADWRTRPQMVEGHRVEDDGLTWTLILRDGLRFHDGTPVLGRDVVASIRRFAQRISFADSLLAATGARLSLVPFVGLVLVLVAGRRGHLAVRGPRSASFARLASASGAPCRFREKCR